MNINLSRLAGKNICVACSGGRDSMALLHYILKNGPSSGITLSAVNCDHGMRGEDSARDSAFVSDYCKKSGIPAAFFKASGFKSEGEARAWRYSCFAQAAEKFNAAVATAHHLGDNAETVLFNLARGCALSGACGISEGTVRSALPDGRTAEFQVVRPLLDCSRAQIDEYIAANGVPFVDDATNFSDKYTRNYIRHNVLPALEKAVPGAAASIRRFCRLAAEDESFLCSLASEKYAIYRGVCYIYDCSERPVFGRAAAAVVRDVYGKKNYTSAHIDSLYALQGAKAGKKFCFLGLTAWREEGRIAVTRDDERPAPMPFGQFAGTYGAVNLNISFSPLGGALRFDADKIPQGAVIRTRQNGDKFTKFGGGTKSLGDFLTDKKVAPHLRDRLPVIACGNIIYAVCGVEISDRIKVDGDTKNTGYILCKAD